MAVTQRQIMCECGDVRCREEMVLTEGEWDSASRRGLVVSPVHRRVFAGRVIEPHRSFLIVADREAILA